MIFIGLFRSKPRTLSPKIVGMVNQAQTLTLTSRAFYNDMLESTKSLQLNTLVLINYYQ